MIVAEKEHRPPPTRPDKMPPGQRPGRPEPHPVGPSGPTTKPKK